MKRFDAREVKLIALDIDGTLLGPDGELGRENRRVVQALLALGKEVVLASGRSHGNMLPYHAALGLSSPLVSVHGAVVRDSTGAEKAATLLADGTIRALTLAGRELGLSVVQYREEGVFLEQVNAQTEFDGTRNQEPQHLITDLLAGTPKVHKVMWLGDAGLVNAAVPRAREAFAMVADIYATDDGYLEFVSPGVSKAAGLEVVCAALGLEAHQVAAFGDGNNDAPMLSWAGLGVAVAHATESAKQAARLIGPDGPAQSALAGAIRAAFGW